MQVNLKENSSDREYEKPNILFIKTTDYAAFDTLTAELEQYVNIFDVSSSDIELKSFLDQKLHGFIIQSRTESAGIIRELDKVFPDYPVVFEHDLDEENKREKFLTQIFTLADFELVIRNNTVKDLVEFQSKNKYLLMASHQRNQKILGSIAANKDHTETGMLIDRYQKTLVKTINTETDKGRNINMLTHMFGYFKEELDSVSKKDFLESLEKYRSAEISYRKPLMMIYKWAVEFSSDYIMLQTVFYPYPEKLIRQ